jgi:hypothetical protein
MMLPFFDTQKNFSTDITESELQEVIMKLKREGLQQTSAFTLQPGQFRITPRYPVNSSGPQMVNHQGEKMFSLAVLRK